MFTARSALPASVPGARSGEGLRAASWVVFFLGLCFLFAGLQGLQDK
jgi:hypothetical protein